MFCLIALLLTPPPAGAYAVLSHEEVVDLAWHSHIKPLLLARYPHLTPDQLTEAHAYAYGGCIIQDIGYYPFGSHFFSDLLHYVRTGDFVNNLLRESTDSNEFAFALGALAHYSADAYGHPAVNIATAQEYPKLRDKYGHVVTYDDSPEAHLQTEFGFDVVEVTERHYAPEQYHDFIGFKVAKPLLERAFRDTYGFEVNQIMPHEDTAIGTYRHTVSGLLPKMTGVALLNYRKQIEESNPGFVPKKFIYRMDKSSYEREFGSDYRKPGVGAHILAFFIAILPKIGPLRALKLRMPDAKSQELFLKSMDRTVDHYKEYLSQIRNEPINQAHVTLEDRNLDTGTRTQAGNYKLADQTYANLLAKIEEKPDVPIPGALRANILAYYKSNKLNYVALNRKKWKKTQADLKLLEKARVTDVKISDQPTDMQQKPVALTPAPATGMR
ncbi:zinc dependent phospholipase C family protein [Acidipila rosea]|uniref:zinc dependent phospholipase C family protein n=1 Tax=Acidipila rosea TaxID=768535 RepID=UPI0014050C74|nr:zinc dependent phospholipase C family protein [Acidipila rosea]